MAVDPSLFHDLPSHISSLHSFLVSDEAISAMTDSVTSAAVSVSAVTDAATAAAVNAAPAAADAADAVAKTDNGWFGFLAVPIEYLLGVIHSLLNMVGFTENTWGVSIIFMTVVIKILTYPLTRSQLESTAKMQTIQPAVKELQAKYASNPEVMNQKVAAFYQENEVNPLAGCIPSLFQIPVFIGLYRAVLALAKEDALNEQFLWLPNLEGPIYGADPSHASDWLFKGWIDGTPPLGWHDTLLFLTIPVFLVISQSISTQLMQPKNADPAQQNNVILKILPLMIGYFSLNVPAALGIYWVANNIITTAITLQIRSQLDEVAVATPGAGSVTTSQGTATNAVFTPSPAREKPSGFNTASTSDAVKPITQVVDVEVVKPKPKVEVAKPEPVVEADLEPVVEASVDDPSSVSSEPATLPKRKKKRGNKKKKKN